MRRRIKVQLTRRVGKKLRSVQVLVYQVTLGGFIEALRVAGQYILKFRDEVRQGGEISERDVRLALLHPEVCAAVADVLCPDQPRGWFRPWHSQKNVIRMLAAASQTSDWGRIVKELNFPGAKGTPAKEARRKRGGGLVGDALLLGRIIGVNPQEIIDAWPLERFLDLCEAVIKDTEAAKEAELLEDPTMDPEAKPTPLIPGLGKQWVN